MTRDINSAPRLAGPALAIVVLQWLLWFGVPVAMPDAMLYGMLGGLICALVFLVWWLFLSRVSWVDRIGALALMVVGIVATRRVVDPSISGGGMGMLMYILAVPV